LVADINLRLKVSVQLDTSQAADGITNNDHDENHLEDPEGSLIFRARLNLLQAPTVSLLSSIYV